MWTVDYEADIESDLSAFHRIDDVAEMDAPRYFSLAARLPAYMGVMAARVEALRQEERNGASGAPAAAQRPSEAAPVRVDADVLLASLAVDGWAERPQEEEV